VNFEPRAVTYDKPPLAVVLVKPPASRDVEPPDVVTAKSPLAMVYFEP
jgi:hypothetical protein